MSNSFSYKPDIDAYFKRIGYTGSREATKDTLFQLQWHHLQAIPYETLDVHISDDFIDISPEVVERKLVANGRGGYCYEHNTFFMHVLRALGFQVKPVTARARWQKPDEFTSGNIHIILIVDIDGRSYASDAGFSSCGAAYPLTFDTEEVQQMPLESRRVIYKDEFYVHQLLAGEKWLDVFVFALHESFPMDWEVGSYFWQKHHRSLAKQVMLVSIAARDCRYRLLNKELVTRYVDGSTDVKMIQTEEEYIRVLRDIFNLTIADGTRICPPGMSW